MYKYSWKIFIINKSKTPQMTVVHNFLLAATRLDSRIYIIYLQMIFFSTSNYHDASGAI